MLRRTLIPDFQTSAMGGEGGPHVLARQALAHFPRFVEHCKGTIGLDLANEMNSTSRNWQRIRQLHHLSGGQPTMGFAALRLVGGHLAQHRWPIVRHIPADKCRTGPTHLPERSKPASLPEGLSPQAVQLFDLAIAFGFSDWQEDQFDAQIQTQSDELSENAWRFVAATKSRVVVELQKLGDSKGFPGVQAMAHNGVAAFIAGNG